MDGEQFTVEAAECPPMLNQEEWEQVVGELALPPQQARVVALILHGKRNKEIAGMMGLSEATVRTYLGRVFAGVNVCDRTELVLRIFMMCHGGKRVR